MIVSTTAVTASQLPPVPQTNIKTVDILKAFNYAGLCDLKLFDGKHPSLPASGQTIKMSMFKGLTAVAPALQLADAAGTNMAFVASADAASGTFSGTVGGATATSMTYKLKDILKDSSYQGTCAFSFVAAAPAGVSVDASTGALSLAPTAVGSSQFTVRIVNQFNVYADFPFTLSTVSAITYDTPFVSSPSLGSEYLTSTSTAHYFDQTVTTAGTIAWTFVSGGPNGTSISSSSDSKCYLSLPATAGVYSIVVKATNPAGVFKTGTMSITVKTYAAPALVADNPGSVLIPFGTSTTSYGVSQTADAGNIAWSVVSGGPTGTGIASSTNSKAYLSIPASYGSSYNIIVKAVNPANVERTATLSITFNNPPIPVFTPTLSASQNLSLTVSWLPATGTGTGTFTGTVGSTVDAYCQGSVAFTVAPDNGNVMYDVWYGSDPLPSYFSLSGNILTIFSNGGTAALANKKFQIKATNSYQNSYYIEFFVNIDAVDVPNWRDPIASYTNDFNDITISSAYGIAGTYGANASYSYTVVYDLQACVYVTSSSSASSRLYGLNSTLPSGLSLAGTQLTIDPFKVSQTQSSGTFTMRMTTNYGGQFADKLFTYAFTQRPTMTISVPSGVNTSDNTSYIRSPYSLTANAYSNPFSIFFNAVGEYTIDGFFNSQTDNGVYSTYTGTDTTNQGSVCNDPSTNNRWSIRMNDFPSRIFINKSKRLQTLQSIETIVTIMNQWGFKIQFQLWVPEL